MTADEVTETVAPIQVRDAFVAHTLLQRLGSKNTYNEVKEAVSSSPRRATLEWASDAISGFGFICNSGSVKVSEITAGLCPSLLLGKEDELAILENVRGDEFTIFDGNERKKRKLNKTEFKQWYSGQLVYAQPELEGHKTVKARLKALSPLRTLGAARFSWIAIAALLTFCDGGLRQSFA
jgi:ABC-type bacteriocin/lantibiotic exporter with double-glycine peptidase domain